MPQDMFLTSRLSAAIALGAHELLSPSCMWLSQVHGFFISHGPNGSETAAG